ncbi:MAG TPA: hypothetical protein VGE02_17030 [Gemmatimonadales bacterium]
MTTRPFHVSPGTPDGARRLLLVSYHFPPGTAVGALRWEMMVRHAASLGWAADVITVDPAALDRADMSRLESLPPGTRVYGVAPAEHWTKRFVAAAVRVRRSLRRGSGAAAAPSASEGAVGRAELDGSSSRGRELVRTFFAWQYHAEFGGWASRVASLGRRLARERAYDAIVSSGPPHLAHEAARRVAASTRAVLAVDFRDPWSLVERVPEWVASPLWFALSERHERRVVEAADVVALNTDRSRLALAGLYPHRAERMLTVMNGTDDVPAPPARHGERFVIAFAGSIYLDRDPRLLFRAAARVVRELGLTPHQLGIELIGNVESYGGVPVSRMAREEGVADFVTTGPPRPRAEALDFLAGAAMLVSLPQDSDMAIPAKVFEYTQFDAWLLIFAARDSATELLLRDSGADVVDPKDLEGTVDAIRGRYLAYAAGERPRALGSDGRFARRTQVRRFFSAVEEALERRGTTARPSSAPASG